MRRALEHFKLRRGPLDVIVPAVEHGVTGKGGSS
jgi:hypothetical protein